MEQENGRGFNPDMLVLARESRELTQRELASKLGVSQAAISKVEAGLLRPSEDLLEGIVRAVHYPVEFFFQTMPLAGLGSGELFHRRRVNIPSRIFARLRAAVAIRRLHLIILLRSVEIRNVRLPALEVEEFDDSPEEVARAIRGLWNMAPGPVGDVTQTLESAGIVIIPCNFGTRLLDATSLWLPGLLPMIIINDQLPVDRYRFTLCHELGHLVMHSGVADPDAENQANEFASEYLMPAQDIGHMFDPLSLERLTVLKEYWRVSMAALLRRAMSLNRISARKYRDLSARMAVAGYRRLEPISLTPERPLLLNSILKVHRTELGYNTAELGRMLRMEQDEVKEWYGLDNRDQLTLFAEDAGERESRHRHLRVVK